MWPRHFNFHCDDNKWSCCTQINWEMTKYKPATDQHTTEVKGSTALLTPTQSLINADITIFILLCNQYKSDPSIWILHEFDISIPRQLRESYWELIMLQVWLSKSQSNRKELIAYLPEYRLVLHGGVPVALSCSSRDRRQSCWVTRRSPVLWCHCWMYRPQSCHWWCH